MGISLIREVLYHVHQGQNGSTLKPFGTLTAAPRRLKSGSIIGSGAYRQLEGVQLRIAPCGIGPTNTIMRAELVAIYAGLLHSSNATKECTIATDSRAAMQAIHKQIHCPLGNQTNTHVVLLRAIATILLWRAQ